MREADIAAVAITNREEAKIYSLGLERTKIIVYKWLLWGRFTSAATSITMSILTASSSANQRCKVREVGTGRHQDEALSRVEFYISPQSNRRLQWASNRP